MDEMDYILCKGDIAIIGSNIQTLLKRLENYPDGVHILRNIYNNVRYLQTFIEELNKKEIEDAV